MSYTNNHANNNNNNNNNNDDDDDDISFQEMEPTINVCKSINLLNMCLRLV